MGTFSHSRRRTRRPFVWRGGAAAARERALASSISLLEATLESADGGILVVDRGGKVARYNRRFVDLWGIPEPILDARSAGDTLAFVQDQLRHPNAFAESCPGKDVDDVVELKDERLVERTSRPLRVDGLGVGAVWSFRDVTRRISAERELRTSEAGYRALFEGSPLPRWLYDTGSLRILAVNDAAVNQYGYARGDFLKRTALDVHASPIASAAETVPTALGAALYGVARHRRSDGTCFDADQSSHVFKFGDRAVGMTIAEDVTQELENELRRAWTAYSPSVKPTIVARTARHVLREHVVTDAADIFALDADPEVTRYTGSVGFESVEDARRFIEGYDPYRREGMGRWIALDASTGDFLGWCGLRRQPDGEVDLGYRYRRAVWGRGLATEASRACLDIAFDVLHLPSIIARADPENAASLRVMQKLGFSFEGRSELEGLPTVVHRLRACDYAR